MNKKNEKKEKKVKETKPEEEKKHKGLRIFGKVCLITLISLAGLFLLVFGGGNGLKFLIYKDFYSVTNKVATIPGLNDNAIPQGITVNGDNYIMSMYMKDGRSPSRLYIQDKNGSSRYVELYEDDEFTTPCTRHCGGVQYVSALNKLFVADAKGYVFEVNLETLMKEDTKKIKIETPIKVDSEASAIFSDNNYVYVSEFNKDGTEWTTQESHHITYNNGTHKSYINAYPIIGGSVDFSSKPEFIYSIPDLIQGVAIKDNVLYMTTSWGISSSHLYFYDINKFVEIPDREVKTLFVTSESMTRNIKCPPMLEDLDFNSEGRLITYNESASNKYIFGKFFFANKIYAIKVN